jgi:perosamine synthetase
MALPRHKIYIPFISLLFVVIKIFFLKLYRGKNVDLLEKNLSKYWDRKRCQTVSSWRLGFHYALKALELDEEDEVLLTPLGIGDIVNAITLLKLKPVFVDMDPNTHNIDFYDLKRKITKKTKVIHITYLSGMVPNLDEIVAIAKENNLIIIEDITQNYGATYKGKLVGKFGDFAIGSFSLGKCIASLIGGFVMTDNKIFHEKIKSYCHKDLKEPKKKFLLKFGYGQLMLSIATSKYFFNLITRTIFLLLSKLNPGKLKEIHHPKYYYKELHKQSFYENPPLLREFWPDDIYSYFTDLQAELALVTFRRLEAGFNKRRELAKTLLTNLNSEIKNSLPSAILDIRNCVYYHFPIYVHKDVEKFQHYMLRSGIDVVGYALPINSDEKVFHSFKQNLPFAKQIKENTTFLPIHDDYSSKDMVSMAKIVNQYFS